MSLPGTQSAKLVKATRGISGDPRFRLFTTLPRGGWIFVLIALVIAVASGLFLFIADGKLDEQARIEEAMECAMTVHSSVNVHDGVVVSAPGLITAEACFSGLAPFEPELDAELGRLRASTAKASAALAGEDEAAEKAAVEEIKGHLGAIERWARERHVSVALPVLR